MSGGEVDNIGMVENLPFLSRSRTVLMMGVLRTVAVLTVGRKSPSTTAKVTPKAFETE